MTSLTPRRLRLGRDLAVAVAVLAAAMLVVTTVMTVSPPRAAAAVNAGEVTFATPSSGGGGPAGGGASNPVTSGGGALPIAVVLPAGAACSGDSSGGGYRVQTFMVPASTDLTTLKFGSSGPVQPAGASGVWYPLFSTTSTPLVDRLTDVATTPNGPGTITGLPLVNFLVYGPGDLPPGEYRVGVACTLGNQTSPTQLDRFWSAPMTFTAASGDPTGVTWTVTGSPVSSSTTTPVDDSTSTTVDGSTTTTSPASTTSTSAGSGASTTISSGVGGVGGAGGAGTGTGAGGSALPATGVSSWVLAAWAFVLVVAGRMAWLFSRRTRVVDPSA